MNIRICVPSYRRPKVITLEYLPQARIYVDESEADDYRRANPGAVIVPCRAGIQGNLCRIRNHILRTEFESGADVVAILDDDYTGMYYWEHGHKRQTLRGEDFEMFLEKYSLLAREWGAFFWGVNVNQDPQCYRDHSPFSTVSYIGGPFQVFLRGGECFYDERLPLKEDYDMTIQQLKKYRIAMRVNKFFYIVKQSEQSGGCASIRNLQREREQLELLRKKWGTDIVHIDKMDRSHKGKRGKTEVFMDYNPVIRPPIRGI